jgi:uncharacterized membrane protein
MMSQNRQTSKDRLAAAHGDEVRLKTEFEIMQVHEKIDDVRMRQLETVPQQQHEQIFQLHRLMEKIDVKGEAPSSLSPGRFTS